MIPPSSLVTIDRGDANDAGRFHVILSRFGVKTAQLPCHGQALKKSAPIFYLSLFSRGDCLFLAQAMLKD
jgi:hypothetical protein